MRAFDLTEFHGENLILFMFFSVRLCVLLFLRGLRFGCVGFNFLCTRRLRLDQFACDQAQLQLAARGELLVVRDQHQRRTGLRVEFK